MLLKNMCIFLIILVIKVTGGKNSDNEKELQKEFIPTREWQVVKKGQTIPKGLHVRVNLETGITEAKLLDEYQSSGDDDKKNALLHIPQENRDDEKLLKTDVIKEALKKIKGDDILKFDEIKKVKEKFRSYDELKKDINSLNLTPKIDAEVLKDLFQQYGDELIKKDKTNIFAMLRILEDFDFLAHQFDNALEFVRQNGFKEVIYKNLNSSDDQIKQETLRLFGSLVQNNGKVQIHALETGSINILLRILNLEESADIKSRAIHALSCLLRRFPLAQLRFVENGGITVVIKILEKDALNVQLKLVTLMNDLLAESIEALQEKSTEKLNISRQYQLINLESLLLEQGWCKYLNKLLQSLIAADPDDHDSIEKCILALHTVANKCVGEYDHDILNSLLERYKSLALNDLEGTDEINNSDFFANLHSLCVDILQPRNIKTEL